jgi:hypothetical protein
MSKIEEIIEKNRNKTDHYTDQEFSDFGNVSVASAMKEYAEWYAKRCLEIAAKESKLRCQGITSLEEFFQSSITTNDGLQDIFVDVDTRSIKNIKLPPHD